MFGWLVVKPKMIWRRCEGHRVGRGVVGGWLVFWLVDLGRI